MITLYQRTDCPFCWKVRLALAELSLHYECVDIRLGERHPVVQELSPSGTVPVMSENGIVVWESGVMLDYLDRRYGPGRLIPTAAAEEVRVRSLHTYSDRLLGACLFKLVKEKRSRPAAEWDQDVIRQAQRDWRVCQQWLDARIAGREFFGPQFGAADCALAARVGVAAAYGAGVEREFTNLYRWFEAVRRRPAWEAAYPTGFASSK